jgi:hypothetical protein
MCCTTSEILWLWERRRCISGWRWIRCCRCWRILWQRNWRFECRRWRRFDCGRWQRFECRGWWRFECRWSGWCRFSRSYPLAWNIVRVARRPRLHTFCAAGPRTRSDRGRGFTGPGDGLRRSCYLVASTQQGAGIAAPIGDAFSSSTIRRDRWRESRTRPRVARLTSARPANLRRPVVVDW